MDLEYCCVNSFVIKNDYLGNVYLWFICFIEGVVNVGRNKLFLLICFYECIFFKVFEGICYFIFNIILIYINDLRIFWR